MKANPRKPRKKTKARAEAKPPAAPKTPTPEQIHQVVKWIVQGASEHDIAEAAKNHWPEQDSRPLIVEAMKELVRSAEPSADLVQAWCFEAMREIYRQAMTAGELGVALRAVRELRESWGSP